MACLYLATAILSTADAKEKGDAFFPGNKDRHLREAAKYRLEMNNDALFDSDNQFSNGWSFQIHSPVADSWDEVEGQSADTVKRFVAWLPSMTADDLKYRYALSIGQIIQTPDDIENPNLIKDDLPYAGVLTVRSSWIAFNDNDFRGTEFVIGVVGRPSVGEQTQNFVHNIIGSNIAQGWDNQLETEPVFNVNYMRKKKFYQKGELARNSFDAAINGDAHLGTLYTAAGASLQTRFGSNMPRGFGYRSDPVGRFMTYDATLAPLRPKSRSIYGTFELGVAFIAHNLLLDGNVFRDTPHSIEKEDVVALATLGFHYERPSWGVHLDINVTTDVVDTSQVPGTPDTNNNFGTLMIEWRI